MAPSLTVKFEQKEYNKLEVTILSCEDVKDLDGWESVSDAYVTVKVGSKKHRTKPVGSALDLKFEKEKSTFLFDNGPDVPKQSWIRFQVMDWDSMSSDDLIGKASIKLSEATERAGEGEPTMLMLVAPSDAETHLSFAQTSAIYKLFAVLDPDNTGTIPEGTQNLVVDSATKEAVLLNELKAFIDDKNDINGDGKVSFGEFLEAFCVHEDPGSAEDINKLTEEFMLIKGA